MSPLYRETKEEIKSLSKEIRKLKAEFKQGQRNGLPYFYEQLDQPYLCKIVNALSRAVRSFQCKHVAMSLFRGRTFEQIGYKEEWGYDVELLERLNNEKIVRADS